MTAYGGGGMAPEFLTSVLYGGEWAGGELHASADFPLGMKPCCLLEKRLGGLQRRFGIEPLSSRSNYNDLSLSAIIR
jgi:hypothetical protein